MRILLFIFSLFSFAIVSSQDTEVVFKHRKFKVVFDETKSRYTIHNPKRSESIRNLRFVKQINEYFQVLDSNYDIYFYNENEGRKDSVIDYYCFVAPEQSYDLSIEVVDGEYIVVE